MAPARRVFVTAGPVHAALDDNKVISNRSRGLWARRLASFLAGRGHEVRLVLSDLDAGDAPPPPVEVVRHHGYPSYAELCRRLAAECDAAVLAAAVTNWIPEQPFAGKMPTDRTRIEIPFVLAPRVIDDIRRVNPRCLLVGCKLTVGAPPEQTLALAYELLTRTRAAAVVANDLRALRVKHVIHPDRAVLRFELEDGGGGFQEHLAALIEDEHYHTEIAGGRPSVEPAAAACFDRIVARHRDRFVRPGPPARVFGALAVRLPGGGALVSPREKGRAFGAGDAVVVTAVDHAARTVRTLGDKATLNAPLLVRMLEAHPEAPAVLHLHEALLDVAPQPYAPAGTARDSLRPVGAPALVIEAHGLVAVVDEDGRLPG